MKNKGSYCSISTVMTNQKLGARRRPKQAKGKRRTNWDSGIQGSGEKTMPAFYTKVPISA